ncbi:hypothetical protein [Komagataeibacter sp. FNDCR2]|uniref:hypothetical protein n=1 Tax=Komagataeibacter sp. FNDCR2 TaxID=2878682 RepID=UPI001E597E12|nr:hypothetical protein [Komagataeibacter sp. FNDCR2]MCE2575540.1 hypothetical protein [Komagataeibacter sp. FNDCR2]
MHDPNLPDNCTQAFIDARFEPEEPAWAARYVVQLAHRRDRLVAMRAELAATRFDGPYDNTDIVGYIDDEIETVSAAMADPLRRQAGFSV